MVRDSKKREMPMATTSGDQRDVVLVGAGIMSATLAVPLKELEPSLKVEIHEVLLHGSVLEFGTELVVAADHSVVAMLGASPGDFGTILCAGSGRRDTYPQAG